MREIKAILTKEFNEAEQSHRKNNKLKELTISTNTERNLDAEASDLVSKWYLNSRVLDGKLMGRYSEVAAYISDKLGIQFTEADVKQARLGLQKSINRSLSDADKVAIVREQISLVFHQASMDRGKAVQLLETLETALQDLASSVGSMEEALLSKSGKSLLFFLQTQQRICQESNDRVLTVLEKMLGFGTTRDTTDTLYRLLNVGEETSKPLTGQEVLSLLTEIDKNGVLPSTTGQVNLDYETFDKEQDDERTITGTCDTIQDENVQETECADSTKGNPFFDSNFPD